MQKTDRTADSRPTIATSSRVTLESVLITPCLSERPRRSPDHAGENRALHRVARAMNASPQAALEALMHEALVLCREDGNATTGVSLLEAGPTEAESVFRWTAMAGRLAHHVGGSTPRTFSPCGVCLDELRPVLFARPDTYFTYFLDTGVPFTEGLVVPFRIGDVPAGTIWIVSHDDRRRFDAEDARIMSSLADFTGLAYQVMQARAAAELTNQERAQLLLAEQAARAEAEAASRAKGEFLAVMSHELRTPLNAIAGYVELLELGVYGAVSDQQREALERVQKSRRHLELLIAEVLTYTRAERGTLQFAIARVALAGTLATCEALTAPQSRAKGVAFEIEACDPGLAVHADEEKLQQIVLNLVGNAIKFTEPGGRIHVRCEPSDRMVAVRVTDTGCGIPADQLDRIFEPFMQVDSQLTRRHEGVGLGLAISRDFARGMGGDIVVASTPGAGSTFTLLLPRA